VTVTSVLLSLWLVKKKSESVDASCVQEISVLLGGRRSRHPEIAEELEAADRRYGTIKTWRIVATVNSILIVPVYVYIATTRGGTSFEEVAVFDAPGIIGEWRITPKRDNDQADRGRQ
jgi:hypothetical protein